MIKFFEKRRILALLLALTILSTVFSSLTMITSTATETTETISYNTNVLYAKGLESLSNGRTIYIQVPKDKITAGESYKVSVIVCGITLTSGLDRLLHVRESKSKTDGNTHILAASNTASSASIPSTADNGTVTKLSSGGSKWTATITPSAQNDIYIGLRLASNYYASTEIYLGGFELIDKNGVNLVPTLDSSTVIYGATNYQTTISAEKNTNWSEIGVKNIDDVTDAEVKQNLVNAFYEGESMLNFTAGTSNNYHAIYKKVPKESLVAGTKYKLSFKYTGLDLNSKNYILIRSGAEKNSAEVLLSTTSTTGEIIDQGSHKEYVDYYTVPDTSTDLYIGFYLHKDTWASANIDLGALKFTDANGKNVVTPLSDMSDIYGSYYGGAISQVTPSYASYNLFKISKLKYDYSKFTNTLYNTTVAHIARGDATNKTTPRSTYIQIADAADVEVGKTYTFRVIYKGSTSLASNKTNRELVIRDGTTKESTNADTVLARSTQNGTVVASYSGAQVWTVDVTPAYGEDLFIGFYTNSEFPNADVYLGGFELIDEDGNDLAIALSDTTEFRNGSNINGAISRQNGSTPTANYYATTEVVNIDDVTDAEVKQDLVNAFYEGESMLNITVGTSNNHHAVYKKVPASKLVAGAKYKLSIKYSGINFNNSDFILVRSGAEKNGAEVLRSYNSATGKFTDYENYSEYVDYITVSDTPNDLYIGAYITKDTWAEANFYFDSIELTDESGKNVVTPLSDMSDIYGAFSGGAINQVIPSYASYNLFTIKKLIYNEIKTTTPPEEEEEEEPTEENTEVVHIARGTIDKEHTTARAIFFKIANAADIVAGETYTITMMYTGTTVTPTKSTRYIGVRQSKDNYVKSYESGTEVEKDNVTTWTVDFTPTAAADLYGCLYTNSECAATDAYIGGIKVVDKNGKDVAIDLSEITDFYNTANIAGSTFFSSTSSVPTSNYYKTFEVITISEVIDENVKKTLKYVLLGIEEQEPPAILKYSVGPTNQSYMVYKKVSADKLVAGTRYKLSVKYSGIKFGKSDYIIVRDDVAKDTPSVLESRTSTSGEFLEHTNYMEYVDYITVPDTPKDLYIGFYLRKSVWETANVYVGGITLTDMNGNNVVSSLGNMTDLYGSFWGNTIKKMDDGPSTYVKVEKLPFDETMFPNDGIALPDYMLYGEYTGTADDSLVVEIPADKLTVGKEYVAEFTSNMLTAQYDEDICFGIFGGPGEGGKTWSEIVYGSALVGGDFASSETNENIRKYTFTLTEKKYDKYYVGFYILGSDRTIKFYVSGLTVYEADAQVKENLVPDDGASMVNWHTNTTTGTATGLGESEFVLYQRANLELTDASFKPKTMLSLVRDVTQANSLKIPLREEELLPNVDYVVSFNYKNYKEDASDIGVGVRIAADVGYSYDPVSGEDTNPAVPNPGNETLANTSANGTNVKELHKGDCDVYFVVNFSEEQLSTYPNIYVTFSFNGYTRVYITDLTVYKKDDPNKVNLLIKDNYSTDMLGCLQDTRAAASKNNEKYNFFGNSYVRYDESQFKKEYNITGNYSKGDKIAYKLDKSQLIADREYKISLNYNFGSDLILDRDISMVVFGDSNGADNVYADTVILDKFSNVKSGKTDRTYTFKVTQEMLDKYDDIYVGLLFNKAVTNIDINFANFVVEDAALGLEVSNIDAYSSKVSGWYTANEKLGATQMSYNFKTVLQHGVQYPKYVFAEIDDGEWWTEEDIEVTVKDYNNTVKGTVIGVDGKPVKNAKIQFVSGTNTYEVVTDSKGAFSLTNIVPGFYQLHWVDKNGNLVSFEYGIDIEKECVVTLNIKVDNLYETTVDENVENAGDLGTIRGTVYTPQLKVVKGLKIYLGKLGYVVTDENGYFEFTNAPVGEYKLYTILENGKEYVFKTVQIKKDVEISTKLKYDPQIDADADASQNNIVLIIVLIAAIVILLGAGVTIILIAAKNKKKASV